MQAYLYHYGSLHINILLWTYSHQLGHIYIKNDLKCILHPIKVYGDVASDSSVWGVIIGMSLAGGIIGAAITPCLM